MRVRPPPPQVRRGDSSSESEPASARAPDVRIFRFDDFTLDGHRGELQRDGVPMAVAPQTVQLLAELVRRPGELIDRESLHAGVWPSVSVSEASLRQAIWELRQALGDSAATPRYVQTVRGRGYRFLARVTSIGAPLAQRPAAAARRPPLLVGRDAPLARLHEALHDAFAQAGRAALLRGPAGIGKSRLARTVMLEATAPSLTRLETSAMRDAGLPPFWPWIRLVDGLLDALGAEVRAAYLAGAPLVARLLTPTAEGALDPHALFPEGPAVERLYLFEALARLFTTFARDRPLLLLLEDVHWLDEASLAFLQYIVGILPRTKTLLLLTSREVPRRENRPLARALDAVVRSALAEIVEVGRLSMTEVTELLASCGASVTAPDLIARIDAITGGNPLYTLQVARMLATHAHLPDETEAHHADHALRRMLRGRLASLPTGCLEVAQAASVWGEECSLAELAALGEESGEHALALVESCVRDDILAPCATPLRYRFAHPLIAEVAYETLSAVERSRLHLRAGCWLEGRSDERAAHLSALAHHFSCAAASGGAERAVTYACASAERAFAATAFDEAVRQYDRALAAAELVPELGAARRLAIELAHAEALQAAGPCELDLNARFLALAERAESIRDAALLARAALGYDAPRPHAHMLTSFALLESPIRIGLLERASELLPDEAIELRARVACAQSFALAYGPERARRDALSDQALSLATRHGSPALLAHTLLFALWTRGAPDAYDAQRALADRLVDLSRGHQLREVELGACLQRLVLALYRGALPDAERDAARACVLADQLGSERAGAASQLLALIKAFWSGDIDRAEQLTEACYRAHPPSLQHESVYLVRRSAIETLRGGAAQLPQMIARMETILAAAPHSASTRCSLTSALVASGRADEAQVLFDEMARADFAAVPEEASWLGDMIALGDCAVRLGDAARAERVAMRLEPFHDRISFFYCDALPAGPVARALAELSSVLGDFTAAEAYLRASRALNQRLDAQLFLLYDQLAEARLLATQRTPGWRVRTAHLLRDVARAAEGFGARWVADSARAMYRAHAQLDDATRAKPA